jgi:transcriptional regulator with XRE-family HTH domain
VNFIESRAVWIPTARHKIVGTALAEIRKRHNVTQVELAQRLAKPQSFVSSYESGQRRIDLLELVRIAEALSLRPLDLVAEIFASLPSSPQ